MLDVIRQVGAFLETPYGGAVLFGVLTLAPFWIIFRRAGLAPWPIGFVFVPVAGPALVFAALAFQKWRTSPAGDAQETA